MASSGSPGILKPTDTRWLRRYPVHSFGLLAGSASRRGHHYVITGDLPASVVGVVLFGDPQFNGQDTAVDSSTFDTDRYGALSGTDGTREVSRLAVWPRIFVLPPETTRSAS